MALDITVIKEVELTPWLFTDKQYKIALVIGRAGKNSYEHFQPGSAAMWKWIQENGFRRGAILRGVLHIPPDLARTMQEYAKNLEPPKGRRGGWA